MLLQIGPENRVNWIYLLPSGWLAVLPLTTGMSLDLFNTQWKRSIFTIHWNLLNVVWLNVEMCVKGEKLISVSLSLSLQFSTDDFSCLQGPDCSMVSSSGLLVVAPRQSIYPATTTPFNVLHSFGKWWWWAASFACNLRLAKSNLWWVEM